MILEAYCNTNKHLRLKFYVIIFAAIISLLTACKKYPEGGYTKQGPKRIVGNWRLTLYEVNGIDSTDLINYNGNDNYKNNSFLKHHSKDKEIIIDSEGSIAEKASFTNKNQKIEFYVGDPSSLKCISGFCYRNYFSPEGQNYNEWKIIKLNKTELTLSCDLINNYIIKFKK